MNPDHLGKNCFTISIDEVKARVAKQFGLTKEQLESRARPDWICGPRFIAFKICREIGYTLQQIGEAFGNRDHGTVLHGCKALDSFKFHPKIQAALTTLRKELNIETETK